MREFFYAIRSEWKLALGIAMGGVIYWGVNASAGDAFIANVMGR